MMLTMALKMSACQSVALHLHHLPLEQSKLHHAAVIY